RRLPGDTEANPRVGKGPPQADRTLAFRRIRAGGGGSGADLARDRPGAARGIPRPARWVFAGPVAAPAPAGSARAREEGVRYGRGGMVGGRRIGSPVPTLRRAGQRPQAAVARGGLLLPLAAPSRRPGGKSALAEAGEAG